MIETRTGGCLCGAVRFEADLTKREFGACHCEMCRRWTGSALLGITVPTGNVRWTGEAHIATRQTSSWAMRAWCRECGSNLYFRVTADSEWAGDTELPIGLFDDANGLVLSNEIYIDHKPDSFAYAGEGRTLLTRQDCIDRFSQLASE
ncbi:GFA family protein [Pararhodobacter sp.]|uniref:GFA family protein n=1 Tax=Pararhodobacter sp. TaxID=2127056 RepID=UPI002FE088E4